MICKVCNKEIKEYYLNDVLGIKKHTICYKCFSELPLIYEFSKIHEYKCLSLYAYKDKIKELIYQFKGLKDIELKDIFLEFFLTELSLKYKGYVITYAPSFDLSNKERGFNHVEEMFSSLDNEKVPLFYKNKDYKQSDQSFKNREKINNIIELKKDNLKGLKKVLIVDDVLTSGNTLYTCASLLYKEVIKDIKLLTISKVVEF